MKNVYVTWHYTTHGVAYLKHILSKFYLLGEIPNPIDLDKLEQEELNDVFNEPKALGSGFLFDEIIYLIASQQAFDNLSTRRFSYKKSILEDELVKKLDLIDVFDNIIKDDTICYNLEAELSFVKKEYPKKLQDFKKVIWRNIQHYSVLEQIKWLKEFSNFKNVYADKIKIVELSIDDLRNEKKIANEVGKWVKGNLLGPDMQPLINVSLGSSETQVVWHALAEAAQLPENTRFIKTYDDKSDKVDKRFNRFSIQEIPTNLITEISSEFIIYGETKSPKRELVNRKMTSFLKSGFSILLIGERGVGKSQIAGKAKIELSKLDTAFKGEIIEANCASFANDTMAESELFGYKKGAFTDAKQDKQGLIESAEEGILFLDEVHHLSKSVQAKLMKALQTDEYNRLSIRSLGDMKEKKVKNVRLIFATNKSVTELKKDLLSDFYDRIVQHVIQIPALRETKEDRLTDWGNVWKGLRFKGNPNVPDDKKITDWLKKLPLYGNYRDLQKVAIYFNAFNSFDDITISMLDEKTPFEYAKKQFEAYHSDNITIQDEGASFKLTVGKNANELDVDFKHFLQDWAIQKYGSRKDAADQLGVDVKSLNNWKNKKQLEN